MGLDEARSPGRLVAGYGFFYLGRRRRWLDFAQRDEACWGVGFLEDFLAVELGHLGVFGVLLDLRVACSALLFAGVLGDAVLLEGIVGGRVDVGLVEHEIVLICGVEGNLL